MQNLQIQKADCMYLWFSFSKNSGFISYKGKGSHFRRWAAHIFAALCVSLQSGPMQCVDARKSKWSLVVGPREGALQQKGSIWVLVGGAGQSQTRSANQDDVNFNELNTVWNESKIRIDQKSSQKWEWLLPDTWESSFCNWTLGNEGLEIMWHYLVPHFHWEKACQSLVGNTFLEQNTRPNLPWDNEPSGMR